MQPFEQRLIALFVRAQGPQVHAKRERPPDVSMMCEWMRMDTGLRRNPDRQRGGKRHAGKRNKTRGLPANAPPQEPEQPARAGAEQELRMPAPGDRRMARDLHESRSEPPHYTPYEKQVRRN